MDESAMSQLDAASLLEYQAVSETVGLIDRTDRIRLSITGPDRAKFLHNLTTNDVKKLATFQGREAFVTSPQGKTLGLVSIHALEDRLIVRSDRKARELILAHFRKYGLFDEIQIEDQTDRLFELHLAGPQAVRLLETLTVQPIPATEYEITAVELNATPIMLIRDDPTGRPGLTLIGPIDAKDTIREVVERAGNDFGLRHLDPSTFETLRIEAGTPVFGLDLTEKNLPQELGRDDRAISFVKGCYLGQETVARIDALGHVNQVLRGFRAESTAMRLEEGSTIKIDDKPVGVLTSSTFSPGWGAWISLGYLRETATKSRAPIAVYGTGGELVGHAVVCQLPMLPPARR